MSAIDDARAKMQQLNAQLNEASTRLARAESDVLAARKTWSKVSEDYQAASSEAWKLWSAEVTP